ncbi:MAG: universal stress protein [Actinomycetes bacterium]
MTFVAGHAPDERGSAALHLAATLAGSSGDDLVVCAVVPRPWFPSMAKVDAEYQAYLDAQADAALDQARRALQGGVAVTFVRHAARSAPTGLLEIAEEHDAGLIVVGSSSAGVFGHVVLGSVTDRLLHSSPVPVALAPRGFRAKSEARVRRVTAAYGGGEAADALAVAAAPVAARVGASLRLATFAVWSRPSYVMRLGTESEDAVLGDWLADMRAAAGQALDLVKDLPDVPRDLESVVGIGGSWPEALEDVDWEEGDILVVGSSSVGPVARVFLGTRASKIVRHSPVPVVVVPRPAPAGHPDRSGQD